MSLNFSVASGDLFVAGLKVLSPGKFWAISRVIEVRDGRRYLLRLLSTCAHKYRFVLYCPCSNAESALALSSRYLDILLTTVIPPFETCDKWSYRLTMSWKVVPASLDMS